jgi:hypothetical protein
METITHIFNSYCIVFCLYMFSRWSSKTFTDAMLKVSFFLMAVLGIVIELKRLNIL